MTWTQCRREGRAELGLIPGIYGESSSFHCQCRRGRLFPHRSKRSEEEGAGLRLEGAGRLAACAGVSRGLRDGHGRQGAPTAGRICDCEMMLLGRLFCLLSVVTCAHVTWKPVMGCWRLALGIFHEKWPVTLPSWTAKDAERFSGLASTLGRTGPVWCEHGTG